MGDSERLSIEVMVQKMVDQRIEQVLRRINRNGFAGLCFQIEATADEVKSGVMPWITYPHKG